MTAAPGPMSGPINVTIDGRELRVAPGTLVIRAAEQLGIVIPRFCDHPLLDPVGACRQCLVEVEGQVKPLASCTTSCTDGMVVNTQLSSDVATKAQQGILEFLLINHPLDCPMCDKGGECPLQDQALTHGSNVSRFQDEKRRYDKPVAVSAQVLLDRERCVLCARCTRFSNEISGDPFIELFERGALEQVAIYEDEPYESYFSGNVIQICPVGALTSSDYRFKARPFDLASGPSVCGLCSAGCNLTVQSRRGAIERQLARPNPDVNEEWSCDKGRFGFRVLNAPGRLSEPLVRTDGVLAPTSWSRALIAARDAIEQARANGPGRVGILTGGRLADQDAYAVSKFARTVVATESIDFRTHTPGPDEDAALAAFATRPAPSYTDVENAPVVLVVGLDPEEEVPILHLRLRKAWRKRHTKVVPIGPRMGSVARYAWRRIATAPGAEASAIAAIARACGVASLAELAVDTSSGVTGDIEGIVHEVRNAGSEAVILVGERGAAQPGVLAAAGLLADAVGAKLGWVPRRAGARGALAAGLAPGLLPGGRHADDSADLAEVRAIWGDLPQPGPRRSLIETLRAAATGEIEVLYLIGVDLAHDCDRRDLFRQALATVDTVIAQDIVETETVKQADIVLPANATQERAGSYTDWEGRSQPFRRVVPGPEQARDDWEIAVQVAAVLGNDLGFADLDAISAEMARLGSRRSRRDWPSVATPSAETPADGRFALVHYPLLLDRGVMTRGAEDLLQTARPAFAAFNPVDAERLGISEGQPVVLSANGTRVEIAAAIEDDIVAGAVYLPTNSTEIPAHALRDGDGPLAVHVLPADAL